MPGQPGRFRAEAAVEKRLTAAGLFFWVSDLAASTSEHLNRSHANLWQDLVNDTGGAKGDGRLVIHAHILAFKEGPGE